MAKSSLPLAASLGALVLLAGCGGSDSVASRSAQAFREAQQRGETFGGDGHAHGHGAPSPPRAGEPGAAGGEAMDREAIDHGGDQVGGRAAAIDHAGMHHGASGTGDEAGHAAGHASGAQGSGQPIDHAATGHHDGPGTTRQPAQPGAHASMGHRAGPGTAPPPASGPVPPGAPAATLAPDPLDAPASTSLIEAQRSAAMAREMGGVGVHGGHGGHGGTGTYRHLDAGRGADAHGGLGDDEPSSGSPGPASGHAGHGSETAGPTEDAEAMVYGCPVHSDVRSREPGSCPICGMALEKRRE
jgi:hypothetical protein